MIKSGQGIVQKITYAKAVYGEEEKKAVYDSMDNGWLASGPLVKEFEKQIAKLFDKKYGIAVNSGSSANLLAVQSLNLPKGAEIITPACTFSTTVSEIVNNGLVPVFVDSKIGRYTIDEDLVEDAINKNTKAIIVPQLIGGVANMPKLRQLADKYNLYLIDDSCDTLAPKIGEKTVASFADATTTSFYGSHIITALGMGGMILTNSKKIRDRAITLRDWGRLGDDKESFDDRFNFEIDGIPYDGKFLYTALGYNLKMNEASAAFGLEQLKRLPGFLSTRKKNFQLLYKFFSNYKDDFYLPELLKGAETNWLAFPLTIKPTAKFSRYKLLKHLEGKGIQTRVLFSGNITRHPVYKTVFMKISGELKNADEIMANGFLIGCHQGLTEEDVDYICASVKEFYK